MPKVYVASSWRNAMQPVVVTSLRKQGWDVYDFRNPSPGDKGFAWSEIDPFWVHWTNAAYIRGLGHPRAVEGFKKDMAALMGADLVVLVMPCGRSAHLELGWAAGAGKQVKILLSDAQEPELMYKMAEIHPDLASLLTSTRLA